MKFIIFIFILTHSLQLQAAEVIKTNKKKGQVIINEGKADGLKKRKKVCFYNNSGRKVACGIIVKLKRNKALVKVKSKKRIKKIKSGYEARMVGKKQKRKKKKGSPNYIAGYYALTLSTPSSIQKLSYDVDNANSGSNWIAIGANNRAIRGGGIETGFGSLTLGLRFRTLDTSTAQADYATGGDNYAEVTQTGAGQGLYADYAVMKLGPLGLLAGIDFDQVKTFFAAAAYNPDEDQIAEAESTATSISLRLRANFQQDIAFLKLLASGVVTVPLSVSASTSASVNDPQSQIAGDQSEDLQIALAHGKGSVGIEFLIGAMFNL